ncbi:hypothetical protein CPB84DRAFT_1639790, partial [Gymnopilus junonius]
SHKFTCGIRTNGRVEVENCITKAVGSPKKSLKELFDALNVWTDGQSVKELIRVRDYAAPYAVHVCHEQMKLSMFDNVKPLQLPAGIQDWHMINNFQNDNSHISTVFLLRLIRGRGLTVQHLIRVMHKGTHSLHIVTLLPDGNYVCDCCMGMNLGLPCRHYFAVLSTIKTLKFNLGII